MHGCGSINKLKQWCVVDLADLVLAPVVANFGAHGACSKMLRSAKALPTASAITKLLQRRCVNGGESHAKNSAFGIEAMYPEAYVLGKPA